MNRWLSLLVLAGLLAGMFPGLLVAGEVAPAESPPAGDVVVRLYYDTQQQLNAIAARYDVWQVEKDRGYALVMLSPGEYRLLLDQGYAMELDPQRTYQVQHPESIPSYPCYRTVEETYDSLQSLNTNYPGLVALYNIGNSWKKMYGGGPGYDLWMMRITNESIPGPKPRFFLMAEIHARELATAELAMRVIEHILQNYGADPTITYFVDYHELYVVPMANPDGRKLAEAGQYWRKNVDNDDGCNSPSYWGVDLNRNYSFRWNCCGGSDSDPCGETYHGPSAGSEPETGAIATVVSGLFPDQRGPGDNDPAPPDATGILITLHSAASLILWPWGWTGTDAPNGAQLQAIGTKLATYNGYTPQQSNDLYTTDGTTDDWSYGTLGIASFTFELAGQFFQPCSDFESPDVPDNRDAILYAWKIARTPYMTVYGPDTLDALATPGAVSPGAPVQLTATINDTQNGNQSVAAAEYYLLPLHGSTPPGDPGTGTPLAPADGSFNSAVEGAVAPVDTSGLAPGAYILAVRGRDAGGNWGPFMAAFLYVVEPGVSPTIEGYVRVAEVGTPIPGAKVAAGIFQATTDATGYYSMTVISGTYDMTANASGFQMAAVSGVTAHNYQVVPQDFELYPYCIVFSDTVEGGNLGWTAGGTPNTWAITTESSHSATHSWTDSPGGNYPNNANNHITSPIFNLTGLSETELSLWHDYQTEGGYDYCIVEYSTNGGSTWLEATRWAGSSGGWKPFLLALPALDGVANARLRLRLTSDYYLTYNGWHVDDIAVRAVGPACLPPAAPTAAFRSNSPVFLGNPVLFTNETYGSPPLEYFWDFGDGLGTSTERDPAYTYATVGTFTVTLVATNSLGSSSVSHPVTVEQPLCHGLANITIAGPTDGLPGVYTFTTSYAPPNADPPIAYLWDNGDTASTTVRTLDVGVHTLAVTATNCTSTVVLDTHTITIVPPCTDVVSLDLVQVTPDPVYTGTVVQLSADILPDDAAKPYSYTIAVDGAPGPARSGMDDPLLFTATFAVTGTHTVEVAAWNCAMAGPATDTVEVVVEPYPDLCEPLTGITIAGPAGGLPGTYTFTTAYEPLSATMPIAYLWDNGDTTDTSIRLLAAGTYTLTVTATNCLDVTVTDMHIVVIGAPPRYWYVYLPVVVK